MRKRVGLTAFAFWCATAAFSAAWGQVRMMDGGTGGGGSGTEGGTAAVSGSAPEFDGPGSVAALALLISVAFIAYNRFYRAR